MDRGVAADYPASAVATARAAAANAAADATNAVAADADAVAVAAQRVPLQPYSLRVITTTDTAVRIRYGVLYSRPSCPDTGHKAALCPVSRTLALPLNASTLRSTLAQSEHSECSLHTPPFSPSVLQFRTTVV